MSLNSRGTQYVLCDKILQCLQYRHISLEKHIQSRALFPKKKTFSGGNFLLKIPLKNQLKNGFPETETEMNIPVENLRVTLYKANTEHSDVDLLQGVSSICSPGVCLYSNFCCAHPGGSVCSATQSPCSSTTLCIRRYSLTNFRRLILDNFRRLSLDNFRSLILGV